MAMRKTETVDRTGPKKVKKSKKGGTLLKQCKVELVRLNLTDHAIYRQAVLHKYKIRDCTINLTRMRGTETTGSNDGQLIRNAENAEKKTPHRQRAKSVFVETRRMGGTEATGSNDGQLIRVAENAEKKTPHRQRAKSVFVETRGSKEPMPTMNDFNSEFLNKFKSLNHGLKKTAKNGSEKNTERKPLTECQKIFTEFQAKLAMKKAEPPKPPKPPMNQNQLSWNEIKALNVKKYPTVEVITKTRCMTPMARSQRLSVAHHVMNRKVKNFLMERFPYIDLKKHVSAAFK